MNKLYNAADTFLCKYEILSTTDVGPQLDEHGQAMLVIATGQGGSEVRQALCDLLTTDGSDGSIPHEVISIGLETCLRPEYIWTVIQRYDRKGSNDLIKVQPIPLELFNPPDLFCEVECMIELTFELDEVKQLVTVSVFDAQSYELYTIIRDQICATNEVQHLVSLITHAKIHADPHDVWSRVFQAA